MSDAKESSQRDIAQFQLRAKEEESVALQESFVGAGFSDILPVDRERYQRLPSEMQALKELSQARPTVDMQPEDAVSPETLDTETVAGSEIDKRQVEFDELIRHPLSPLKEFQLVFIEKEVAPLLHAQWAMEHRKEGVTEWWRPSGLSIEASSEWAKNQVVDSTKTRVGKSKLGEDEYQIDILNIPFEKLTPKWQTANESGAKRAAFIINRHLKKGQLTHESLDRMAEEEHIGWILDPSNTWKIESSKGLSSNPEKVEAAVAELKGFYGTFEVAATDDEKQALLRKLFETLDAAITSLIVPAPDGTPETNKKIKDVQEVKMQFGRYKDLSLSEKLKDIDRIMVGLRAAYKLQQSSGYSR